MKHTRREVFLLALLAIIGWVSVWVLLPPGLSAKDAEKLSVGMSHTEVYSRLGQPDQITPGVRESWLLTDGFVHVHFDSGKHDDETVVQKFSVVKVSRMRTVLIRLRVKFGI